MERYTMVLVVIIPVPQHLPTLVQPHRTYILFGPDRTHSSAATSHPIISGRPAQPSTSPMRLVLVCDGYQPQRRTTNTRSMWHLRTPIINSSILWKHLLRFVRLLKVVRNSFLIFFNLLHLWPHELSNAVKGQTAGVIPAKDNLREQPSHTTSTPNKSCANLTVSSQDVTPNGHDFFGMADWNIRPTQSLRVRSQDVQPSSVKTTCFKQANMCLIQTNLLSSRHRY